MMYPYDRAFLKAPSHPATPPVIAMTASDPFDLCEPLFRCFDHLLDASQDVRVEDRS